MIKCKTSAYSLGVETVWTNNKGYTGEIEKGLNSLQNLYFSNLRDLYIESHSKFRSPMSNTMATACKKYKNHKRD